MISRSRSEHGPPSRDALRRDKRVYNIFVPKLVLLIVLLAALMMPVATNAECVTVTLRPYGELREPVAKPGLIFIGTVTTVEPDRYLVSFQVERVWTGQLRRETTFFVAPVVEGAGVSSFHAGTRYLVTAYGNVYVYNAEEAASGALPPGTLGIAFGCGDGPTPFAEAKDALNRLGRGRAPTP